MVLKTDTEYRRWYNKGKKSGASSFFENRGQLLRRFGNEHDYGGDEYADADGWKNQSFAEVVIPRVDVDEDSEESTVSVLKMRTVLAVFKVRSGFVPPV